MSKLLELLYREYTRSRMAEMDAAKGFADIWRTANHQRSEDIAKTIGAVLQSERQATQEPLAAQVSRA